MPLLLMRKKLRLQGETWHGNNPPTLGVFFVPSSIQYSYKGSKGDRIKIQSNQFSKNSCIEGNMDSLAFLFCFGITLSGDQRIKRSADFGPGPRCIAYWALKAPQAHAVFAFWNSISEIGYGTEMFHESSMCLALPFC